MLFEIRRNATSRIKDNNKIKYYHRRHSRATLSRFVLSLIHYRVHHEDQFANLIDTTEIQQVLCDVL